MSARRGRARPGRYRNPHFHGYHSTSPSPILAVLGAVVGGVVLLLIVLAVTHAHPTRTGDDTAPVSTAPAVAPQHVAPAPASTPAPPCYPFAASCN